MTPGLDHIVIPSGDLDGLAETYRRLGFNVGRRNRHPWGTENNVIQFPNAFLELLGFASDYVDLPPKDPAFPFAEFMRESLRHRDGHAAMTVLRSADAGADAARFEAAGIGAGRLLPFSRAAQGPDGSDRTVAFTVAFADASSMPEIGFFTCQQHRPENFWNPAMQVHDNGVTGIAGLVIVADDPATPVPFLRAFTGSDDVTPIRGGVEIVFGDSRIAVMTPADADGSATTPADARHAPRIASVHFTVAAIDWTAKLLAANAVPHSVEAGQILVDVTPELSLVFAEA